MMRKKEFDKMMKNKKVSFHTKIGFLLGVLAFSVQFIIGFRHINDVDQYSRTFAQLNMIEGAFALFGLYLTDIFYGKDLQLYPKKFKPLFTPEQPPIYLKVFLILAVLVVIQVVVAAVPLTIPDIERGLSIMFAGPAEELAFRGAMLAIFFRLGESSGMKFKLGKKEISLIEIVGIMATSMVFALIHLNYFQTPRLVLMIFLTGIALGFFMWYWKDLLAVILAHFALNLITVYQSFYLFNL